MRSQGQVEVCISLAMTLPALASNITTVEPNESAWYCVRSQPRRDHIAAANLRRLPELDVFTPRIRFRRSTRRGLVWVTEQLFPNYIFARFDKQRMLTDVQHTFRVAGVVHFGPTWPTVPPAAIEELRQAVGDDETCLVEHSLEVNQEVQISAGAFQGIRAVVTRLMPARQRVAVLLDFLGKQTLVELDRNAVTSDTPWSNIRGSSLAAVRLAEK